MGLFGPSGDEIKAASALIKPDQANYQIAGIPQYQSNLQENSLAANGITNNGAGNYSAGMAQPGLAQQAAATNMIANTAAGNGPSLARANMMAGLNQNASQIASQAMTNQGNTAGGLSQRNLLNAQAGAANNAIQGAGTASVAEQLGAQANYANAANAQTQGAMTNAMNASNTGLMQNQQRLAAAQMGSQNLQAGQTANTQQAQANMGYDQQLQGYGRDQTGVNLQAVSADGSMLGNIVKTVGGIASAAAPLMGIPSDEKLKEDIKQGTASDSKIGTFLNAFMSDPKHGKDDAPATPGSNMSTFTPGQVGRIAPMGGAKVSGPGLDYGQLGSGFGNAAGGLIQGALHKDPQQPMPPPPQPMVPMDSSNVATAQGYGAGPMGGALRLPPAYAPIDSPDPLKSRSDERCKTDKAAASNSELSSFMGSMEPSTFKYKDQSYSPGQHFGVMAQDVDDSKLGGGMVMDTPHGKAINVPKAMGASLASLAYLNKRIDKLEGKKR